MPINAAGFVASFALLVWRHPRCWNVEGVEEYKKCIPIGSCCSEVRVEISMVSEGGQGNGGVGENWLEKRLG
jgi:hypothetical protein